MTVDDVEEAIEENEEMHSKESESLEVISDESDLDTTTDLDKTQKTEDELDKTLDSEKQDLNSTFEGSPKKDVKKPSSTRKKLTAEMQKVREEREKKRLEAKENKEKLKKEKQELKVKERQEKEELRKKEKLEKEEQKRKEREEKEELKKKEREEKEEQKKKEREEKEEQKRKEREEKEEQKRKEREEKEMKKQQEIDKDKKKLEKESAAFVNFFVSRKSTGAEKKPEEKEISSFFMPFEIKADMRLAPIIRQNLSEDQKQTLTKKLEDQDDTELYLKNLKNRQIRKSQKTWPVEDDCQIIEDEIGECVEEQTKSKMRAKFLKFEENRRPPYFGTWRKKSKSIKPRKPFNQDKIFDYEIDSDDEWEEEEPGESLHGSDDEEKEMSDEYEVDNEFFVPHGYLSDEEAENEENQQLTPETQKEKLKLLQMEFEEEMKSKTERIKPRLIGCIWNSKLKPKIQDAITTFLEERMMILSAPIIITKREKISKIEGTPQRKLLGKEFIPDFLQLVHGSVKSNKVLIDEFLNLLNSKNNEVQVSKIGLKRQLKELAKWRKCPEEGVMFNKYCWYVSEDVRKQYNLNLVLPNKWNCNQDELVAKKKLNV